MLGLPIHMHVASIEYGPSSSPYLLIPSVFYFSYDNQCINVSLLSMSSDASIQLLGFDKPNLKIVFGLDKECYLLV